MRLRISVFYGRTYPLLVPAFNEPPSLPSTANLQVFYNLLGRMQHRMIARRDNCEAGTNHLATHTRIPCSLRPIDLRCLSH